MAGVWLRIRCGFWITFEFMYSVSFFLCPFVLVSECEGLGQDVVCLFVHVIHSPHDIEECQGLRVVLLTFSLTFRRTETLVSVTLFFFPFYFLPHCHYFSYDYCVPFTMSFASYLFPLQHVLVSLCFLLSLYYFFLSLCFFRNGNRDRRILM